MHEEPIKIDLHVHTAKGSPCAESHDPMTLPGTMVKANLQGIVITEHNMSWPREEVDLLNTGLKNRKIYRGMEISSGKYHFIIIGFGDTSKLYAGMPPDTLIQIVNSQGGVVILAHPYLGISGTGSVPIPPGVSAVEVLSTVSEKSDITRSVALCNKNNLHSVAGSDAHCRENVGAFYTIFPHLPINEKELAAMIRNGRTTLPTASIVA